MDVDFKVSVQGSIWLFEPVTETAKNFTSTDLQVEGWQWMGKAFGVDARIGNDLVSSLEDEGFVLEIT
jgi:hypothetical protein